MMETAVEAARAGGEILLSYWRRLPAGSVAEKGRNDFVSRADRESEAAIVGTLLGAFPGDAILAEEGGRRAGTSGREWVIDPLDGTSNYIAGFPFWGVSIAARQGGETVAGVVWDPLRGEMYQAEKGAGARRNGEALRVSGRQSAEGAFLATGFPFRAKELIDDYLAIFKDLFLKARAIRRAGSAALDLAQVASGVFDGFFEFRLSPWDIAAGALLIEEAGGCVRGFGGGTDPLATGNVVAGSGGLVEEILAVIRSRYSTITPA
jgi:myo-inositol-1(or 4)-monophosphatase